MAYQGLTSAMHALQLTDALVATIMDFIIPARHSYYRDQRIPTPFYFFGTAAWADARGSIYDGRRASRWHDAIGTALVGRFRVWVEYRIDHRCSSLCVRHRSKLSGRCITMYGYGGCAVTRAVITEEFMRRAQMQGCELYA